MNVAAPIRKLISLHPGAFALVGARVFPIVAPQNTSYPCAIITVTGNSANESKCGTSKFDDISVRVDCFAVGAAEAIKADEQVRLCIDGFRGDVTFEGATVAIDGIKYVTSDNGYEPEPVNLCRATSLYQFRWNRTGEIGGVFMYVDDLNTYASNAAAITAGLTVGDWYIAAAGHESAFPGTLVKILDI